MFLAGELSLMSALASGQLVNSHMKYNRLFIFIILDYFLKQKIILYYYIRAATAETIKQLSSNIHCFI